MTSFLKRNAREIKQGVIHLWWVFVIVAPLCGLGLWLAIDHANANQTRALARSNQQFRKAQILANHKFQQALRISTAQNAYSINKSVCTLRPFLEAALKARLAAVRDATNQADKKLNQQAADTYTRLLTGEVTVPAGFPCATLPKTPPKAHP